MLDASKAFDRVNFLKLFNELLKKGICPVVCKYLAIQYSMQKCQVKWSKNVSTKFDVSNGVKQGGVLSPVLFTIYMDVLLERLRRSGSGCYIGNVFMGAFGYADDIILLAPTRSAMDSLILICEQFSEEYSILFNASKSKHLFFSDKIKETQVRFTMQGSDIPNVLNDKHLGNWIGLDKQNKSIDACVSELYINTNLLLSQFARCNVDVKYRLFKSYCMCLYGSQLWDFSNSSCNRLYTAWRKCIRRLFGIPNTTHNRLLHLICNDVNVQLQLQCRMLNFLLSCSKSKSAPVHLCLQLALNGSRSSMSRSWFYVCRVVKMDRDVHKININRIKAHFSKSQPSEDLIASGLIHDLLCLYTESRDTDIIDLVSMICTS